MGLLDRIFNRKKKAVTLSFGGNEYFLENVIPGIKLEHYNTRDFRKFAMYGYGGNAHVYAVTSRIARNMAQMPRCWFDDWEGEEKSESDREVQDITLKLKKPDTNTTQNEFLELISMQLLTHGNAIVYPEYPIGFESFDTVRLRVARMQDVTVQTTTGDLSGIPLTYTFNGVQKVYLANEVLHIVIPNNVENSYIGLSPLYAGQMTYTASNNNMEAQASIHGNRGVSGILSPKDSSIPLLATQQEEMQKDWNRRTAGANKTGGVHVTGQAMQYTPIGLNATDLKLIESDLEHLRSICRIYGVSSALFNDKAGSTYNNVSEAKEDYYSDVLYPLSRKIDLALSEYLSKMIGVNDKYWQVDKSRVKYLSKVETDLSDRLIKEVQAGIIPPQYAAELLYPNNDFSNFTNEQET